MVNLELYRVFWTVAKRKSITKAAEELFISQPAVSQSIKQLESQLNGKLFHRVARGMELTETGGKQMFEIVDKAITMLDEAEKMFTDIKGVASGCIKIACSDNVTTRFLLKYIKLYKELYPNVSLSFFNGTSKECLEHVKENKADIGFVNLPILNDKVHLAGQAGEIHDIFVASSKFSELFDKEVQIATLSNYPLLMLDATTMTRQKIDEFLHGLSVKLTPDMELGSIELLVAMAKQGFGIACVPREYVEDELKSGALTEINVSPQLPVRAIGVISGKNETLSFAVKEFLKILNK